MLDKSFCNKILLVGLLTFYFFMFELAFIVVLMRSLLVLSILEILLCQILSISLYTFLFYVSYTKRIWRINLSIFFSILSLVALLIFVLFHIPHIIEVILSLALVLAVIVFIIIKVIIKSHLWALILKIIIISLFCILAYFFLSTQFFISKVIFLSSAIGSVIALFYSIKTFNTPSIKPLNLKLYFKLALVSIPLISASFLFFPIKSVEIDPDGEPELVFWSDPFSLPRSNTTLQTCAQNGITFTVVLRTSFIDSVDERTTVASRIQNLIDAGLRFHITIGGPSGDFYCHIDNADTFLEEFKIIRAFLLNYSLYAYIDSINVDAESPGDYFKQFETEGYSTAGQYYVKSLPSERDIEKAEEGLKEFLELIHADGKDAGIIMNPIYLDEEDGDSDQAQLQKTIYWLDLDFDYSVTMLYRTQRVPSVFDYALLGLKDYHYLNDYEIDYYKYEKEDRYLMPLSEFYYKVSLEMSGSPVGVKGNERYIFIGNFHSRNKYTSYIKDKEYKKDLDICKHFEIEKVFLYEWSSFISRYGEEELEKLGSHNQHNKKWVLTFPSYSLYRELAYVLIIVMCDRFLYL